ncbi:MAG: EAL domain-containing protein, partial [Desulfovibrio sp.]|nr:EAL domain-containing protein [Desulfovibrio sp.]
FSVLPRASFAAVPAPELVSADSNYKVLELHGELFVYSLVRDVFGTEAFCVESRAERFLSLLGEQISRRNFFSMLVLALFFLGTAIFLLHLAEQKVRQTELDLKLNHDGLTGLCNKSKAQELFSVILSRHPRERMGVIFFNLDHFRSINNSYGYEVGDAILREVAGRLVALASLALVARYEGDKFLILVEEKFPKYLEIIAQECMDTMCEAFNVGDRELLVTASAGVAVYPKQGTTVKDLVRRAEIAMYQAKKQGRSRLVVFESVFEAYEAKRLALQLALTKALDEGTLTVFYQPKVNLDPLKVSGCEALVRWQHDGRWISPLEFIPLAEETGLVTRIDLFVLHAACQQIKTWLKQGLDLRVAVNMSGKSILDKDFAVRVKQLLREEKVPPASLEVEITETTLMDDLTKASYAIKLLDQVGVSIALDDFGTGYSSLSYLYRLPISTLKIDKTFIDGLKLGGEENSVELVKGIFGLAQALSMQVVAEGVEDLAQLKFLQSLGCQCIQGYLFAKPLAAKDFSAYLAKQKEQLALLMTKLKNFDKV